MQLPASATLQEASALEQGVEQALTAMGPGAAFEVDASALTSFDSSVLALLLQSRRLAGVAGRGFAVSGAPAKLVQLARLYGVDGLLGLAAAGAA